MLQSDLFGAVDLTSIEPLAFPKTGCVRRRIPTNMGPNDVRARITIEREEDDGRSWQVTFTIGEGVMKENRWMIGDSLALIHVREGSFALRRPVHGKGGYRLFVPHEKVNPGGSSVHLGQSIKATCKVPLDHATVIELMGPGSEKNRMMDVLSRHDGVLLQARIDPNSAA